MNQRNSLVDIMKGICIVLVVLGHTYNSLTHDFIYLFHVAVFYILSGYCYKGEYSDSVSNIVFFTKKRLSALWIPYISYNSIFLLLQNILLHVGLLTSNDDYFLYKPYLSDGYVVYLSFPEGVRHFISLLFFKGTSPFCGGLWFLGGLFYIQIYYVFIDYILKKIKLDKIHIFISCILLVVGWLLHGCGYQSNIKLLNYVSLILITEPLFAFGVIMQRYAMLEKKIHRRLAVVFVVITTLILMSFTMFGSISIGSVEIINPFFFICSSFIGFIFVYGISSIISDTYFSSIFLLIGKHTIVILALHTLAFKIVTYLQYIIFSPDKIVLSLFPVWKNTLEWAVLYTGVGVTVPLIISIYLGKINFFKKYFKM